MRANVNLDADVYTFASSYASARGIPLGAAISELIRRVEVSPDLSSGKLTTSRHGLLVRARAGHTVTLAEAKELSEDDLD